MTWKFTTNIYGFFQKETKCVLKSVLVCSIALLMGLMLTLVTTSNAVAGGGGVSNAASKLKKEIRGVMIQNGFCKTDNECMETMPSVASRISSMAYIPYYEVTSAEDYKMLTFIINFVLVKGLDITEGTPIVVEAYRESYEEYQKSGLIFKNVKPFITLEIKK